MSASATDRSNALANVLLLAKADHRYRCAVLPYTIRDNRDEGTTLNVASMCYESRINPNVSFV